MKLDTASQLAPDASEQPDSLEKTAITVAYGDGIGPEIMQATLQVLQAAGARIAPETVEIGEKVYLGGNSAGIESTFCISLIFEMDGRCYAPFRAFSFTKSSSLL